MSETVSLPPFDSFDSFWEGVAQFNRGEFYACHDTLEAIWMVAPIPEKPFFQGILQLAVALYHLGNQNWQGAAILLGEGMGRLEPFEPAYGGIDVSDLLDRASLWQETLQALGPDQVSLMAAALQQAQRTPLHPTTAHLPPWTIHRADNDGADDGMP